MKRNVAKLAASGLSVVLMTTMLTGCRFGFASDPDDPNEEEKEEPIDTSVDTISYDSSLNGTKMTLLNSKAEIQVALEKMGDIFEEKSGVHVEVMPVTDGDSPYTKGRHPPPARSGWRCAAALRSWPGRWASASRSAAGRWSRRSRAGKITASSRWKSWPGRTPAMSCTSPSAAICC